MRIEEGQIWEACRAENTNILNDDFGLDSVPIGTKLVVSKRAEDLLEEAVPGADTNGCWQVLIWGKVYYTFTSTLLSHYKLIK